jgi:hypothetical protein
MLQRRYVAVSSDGRVLHSRADGCLLPFIPESEPD